MRGHPSCLLTMSAFDRLVTLAPRLARERCQVAAWHASGSLPSAVSLYAHAYCHSNSPKTFKGTHNVNKTIVSFLQEWAFRLLPRHWCDNNTSSHWIWRNFGIRSWSDILWLSGSFFHYLERSWLDLRGNDFTYVIRKTGPPRSWR